MRKELPKQYDPTQVESQIYQMWLDSDCFKAEPDPDKKPYSIVMPPPNVLLCWNPLLLCWTVASALD